MGQTERDAATVKCPFLRPGLPIGPVMTAIYCGLPGGRVRMPPPEDVRRYCIPGRFEECPTYGRYAAR
jgi:hypothetical protein